MLPATICRIFCQERLLFPGKTLAFSSESASVSVKMVVSRSCVAAFRSVWYWVFFLTHLLPVRCYDHYTMQCIPLCHWCLGGCMFAYNSHPSLSDECTLSQKIRSAVESSFKCSSMFFLWPTGVHFADLRKRKHGTLVAVLSTFYLNSLCAKKAEIIRVWRASQAGLCYAPENFQFPTWRGKSCRALRQIVPSSFNGRAAWFLKLVPSTRLGRCGFNIHCPTSKHLASWLESRTMPA
jgi:hypothetical protein